MILSRRSRKFLRRTCLSLLLIIPIILFITNLLLSAGVLSMFNDKSPQRSLRKSGYKRNFRIDNTVVPNIAHYVWMRAAEFEFHHYLSVLSIQEYLSPRRIYFHLYTDRPFFRGRYWESVRKLPNIRIIFEKSDVKPYGISVTKLHHRSIVARLHALQRDGGVYLDADVIFLKSVEPLLHYQTTLGKEFYGLSPGIIFTEKNSTFVQNWLKTFKDYDPETYDESSKFLELAIKYQDHLHVEQDNFRRNDLHDLADDKCENIYHGYCDHKFNYAIKLYYNFYSRNISNFSLDDMQTTFGDMARKIMNTEITHNYN
ncbi:uncharacterized protein LOC117119414 [Anneissia japonica]|uniref:uncharacterized protein LOC117119414 n=1 Tax=Anneissia japonica TaxID=1529436 RepID=UPI0014259A91|nr:uncharacterized protein LOC117119414 [Anneissia japonica]